MAKRSEMRELEKEIARLKAMKAAMKADKKPDLEPTKENAQMAADKYNALRDEINDLKDELDSYRDVLIGYLDNEIQGDLAELEGHNVVRSMGHRSSWDEKALARYLTDAQLAECKKTSTYSILRVKDTVEVESATEETPAEA